MDDPKVIAAVISGLVSLTIASVTGIYTLIQTNRKIGTLRKEIIETRKTERFLTGLYEYRNEYRKFESEAARISAANPNDGTPLLQRFLDFYATSSKPFYEDNLTFFQSKELDRLKDRIARNISSASVSSADQNVRLAAAHSIFEDIKHFVSVLYEKSQKI